MEYKKSIYNLLVKQDDNDSYVFNCKKGIMAIINNNVYKSLDNGTISDEKIDELRSLGIVVPFDYNEKNHILKNEKITMLSNSPTQLDIVIAPTMLCNLKCVYCFEENACKEDGFDNKTVEQIYNFLTKYIKSFSSLKILRVKWFGGEPLLKYNEIVNLSKKLIEFCDNNNIVYKADIITNGVLLTKDRALILKNECRLLNCQITLDGFEQNYCKLKRATKGQYDSVINNICDAADILQINIRLNANNENYDELKRLAKYLLKDLKLENKVSIYLADLKSFECNADFNKQDIMENETCTNNKINFIKYLRDELKVKKYFLPLPKAKKCHCLFMKQYNFIIGPKGEFYRCEHLIGEKDKVIGDSKIGFYYNDYEMNELELQHDKKCYNCPVFPVCLGGCRDERKHIPLSEEYCREQINYIKNLLLIKLENNTLNRKD